MLNSQKFLSINDFELSLNNIYKTLHESSMYDKYLEKIKNFFMKKYNFSTFCILTINTVTKKLLYNSHTDNWTYYNWDSYEKGLKFNIMNTYGWKNIMEEFIFGIKNNEKKILIKERTIREIDELKFFLLGFVLNNCYSVILEDEKKNIRTLFWFSFHNDYMLRQMSYNIYLSLIKDFNSVIDILDVFLEYFSLYNRIDDSVLLESMLKNKNFQLNSLF
jgi:hypothetical protein